MKVLELNTYYLSLTGILPSDNKIVKRVANCLLGFGVLYGVSITSATYIYFNFHDVTGSVNALIPCLGGLSCGGAYLCAILNGKSIKTIYNELQTIVDIAGQ